MISSLTPSTSRTLTLSIHFRHEMRMRQESYKELQFHTRTYFFAASLSIYPGCNLVGKNCFSHFLATFWNSCKLRCSFARFTHVFLKYPQFILYDDLIFNQFTQFLNILSQHKCSHWFPAGPLSVLLFLLVGLQTGERKKLSCMIYKCC